MRKILQFSRLSLLLVFVLVSMVTYAQDDADVPVWPEPGSYTAGILFDDLERIYRIYIPESYPEAEDPVPLVFVLHGAGDIAPNIELATGFSDLAEEAGFIAIYPQGVNGLWNAGQDDEDIAAVDDTAFILKILEDMTDRLNLDTGRVYVTGFSMGAMMAYRLGCELEDEIAAIAAVGSPFPAFVQPLCEEAAPVSVLMMHGTADNVVPGDGRSATFMSIPQSFGFWMEHNECSEEEESLVSQDFEAHPMDGSAVEANAAVICADDTEVWLYAVIGGEHNWPGARGLVQRQPFQFNATETIWSFFADK